MPRVSKTAKTQTRSSTVPNPGVRIRKETTTQQYQHVQVQEMSENTEEQRREVDSQMLAIELLEAANNSASKPAGLPKVNIRLPKIPLQKTSTPITSPTSSFSDESRSNKNKEARKRNTPDTGASTSRMRSRTNTKA